MVVVVYWVEKLVVVVKVVVFMVIVVWIVLVDYERVLLLVLYWLYLLWLVVSLCCLVGSGRWVVVWCLLVFSFSLGGGLGK